MLLLSITTAQAGQVTLAWNASSGPVAGYQVNYWTTSVIYTTNVNAGNTTRYTVSNLVDGRTYYFAVKAYGSAGNQSGFSNEVKTTVGVTTPLPSGGLPSPWLGMDIGNIGVTGSASHSNGAFTLQGSGADIWGAADAFRFVYQPLSGNGSIVARVASMTNTNGSAKVGVMIRENLDANARHALVALTPSNGVRFIRRTSAGGSSSVTAGAAAAAPYWLKLTRAGNTFTAHQSANGSTWTQIGSAVTISMGASVYVGLALTSANNAVLNTATLDNVSVGAGATTPSTVAYTFTTQPSGLSLSYGGVSRVTPFTVDAVVGSQQQISAPTSQQNYTFSNWSDGGATTHTITIGSSPQTLTATYTAAVAAPIPSNPLPGSLPSPWYGWDIGNVGLRGSSGFANNIFTLKGSGADIWGTADAFRFTYQSLNGDGSIVARVTSLTNTHAWAKAGVMIRENLDANARHVLVAVTPGNGVAFQRRTTTGGSSAHTAGESSEHAAGATVKAPYWVKLTRTGRIFTAYQSANGSTWTQIGSVAIRMPTSVYVGLAVTSHDNTTLTTTILDKVSVQ